MPASSWLAQQRIRRNRPPCLESSAVRKSVWSGRRAVGLSPSPPEARSVPPKITNRPALGTYWSLDVHELIRCLGYYHPHHRSHPFTAASRFFTSLVHAALIPITPAVPFLPSPVSSALFLYPVLMLAFLFMITILYIASTEISKKFCYRNT
jgi:hypothetical protein